MSKFQKSILVFVLVAVAVSLVGCEDPNDPNSTGNKVDRAAHDAVEDIGDTISEIGDNLPAFGDALGIGEVGQ